MNSIQESTNELNAAIRYAENAITSAKQTIESMQFRQDMAKKQYTEQTGREQALEREVQELKDKVQGQYDDIVMLERENAKFRKEKEASSAPCGCQAYRDLEEQTGREQALEREVADLKERLKMETAAVERIRGENYKLQDKLVEDIPNMPTIPKDVAIAIFREGIKQGVYDACDELDNSNDVHIEESGYSGGFEVSFSKYIDLSEHLDLDWMRGKVGSYEEEFVIIELRGLCETKGFECRIHGIDEKKTPKIQ